MFDFPKATYKKFNKNFLKSVIFQISYAKKSEIINEAEEIESIFKEEFPRFTTSKAKSFQISFIGEAQSSKQPSLNESDAGDVILMRSIDGHKVINITEEALTVTINGAIYESFQQIKDILESVNKFLHKCKINEVLKVAIRKINIIEFHLPPNQNATDILARLLNPNLIGNISHFPKKEDINHNMQSLNYNKQDGYLNIKYGLNIPKNNSLGQVIIDIDLVSTQETNASDIENLASDINMEIFNIFNWVLSQEAISILN